MKHFYIKQYCLFDDFFFKFNRDKVKKFSTNQNLLIVTLAGFSFLYYCLFKYKIMK